MDSIDIAHVPDPNPAHFWEFSVGQSKHLGGDCHLKLLSLDSTQGFFTMLFYGDSVGDFLHLDRPCVALRLPNGEPALTLTLREIRDQKAYLQITAHEYLEQSRLQ